MKPPFIYNSPQNPNPNKSHSSFLSQVSSSTTTTGTLALPTMEAFSLLKFWRNAAGGGASDTDAGHQPVESDEEEETFFDLEFAVPGSDEKEDKDDGSDTDEDSYNDLAKKDGVTDSDFVESPNDVFFKGTKPLSPISFLRSPPKFRVFMLFKKPKLEKIEPADASPATHQQSKRFAEKCKAEEVSIFSLLARVNSSRSNSRKQSSENGSSKRFAKDVVQKYLKLIKPIYVRASKRYTEKQKFTDDFSTSSTPLSSPAAAPVRSPRKQAEEKHGSRQAPLREVCKHLGKSRSASSAVGIIQPVASRRNDSLLEQHDGIQSAILHCKRSYNSSRSRDFSAVSRTVSKPCHEISVINPSRNSTEEVKTRISI